MSSEKTTNKDMLYVMYIKTLFGARSTTDYNYLSVVIVIMI